jgi:hypothetical protein
VTPPAALPRPGKAFAVAIAVHAGALFVVSFAYLHARGPLLAAETFQTAIPELVSTGHPERAAMVARMAVQRNALDPEAHHLLGTALLAARRAEAAQKAYDRLFHLGAVEDEAHSEGRRPSMRPFYYAPARLALARHHFEQNRANTALENAALALSFGQDIDDPGIFRDVLMESGMAYTALEHGEDSDDPRLVSAKILRAWVEGDWKAIRAWADADRPEAPQLPLAHALAAPGDGSGALGLLENLDPADTPDLPFVRGLALAASGMPARAAVSFLDTPAESVFYPFALAKATALGVEHDIDARGLDEAPEMLAAFLDGDWEVPPPAFPSSPRLAGLRLQRVPEVTDAPWHALLCWETAEHPVVELTQVAFPLAAGIGGRVAELRAVAPLNPFPLAMDGGPADTPGPGWSWLPPRDGRHSGAGVTIENGDPCLRIQTNSPLASALVASPPVPVPDDSHFLLAVRCRSDGARLVAGWIWLDANENEVLRHNVLNQVEVPGWTWQVEYIERPAGAVFVQAIAGIYNDEGAALFRDLLILPMPLPDTSRWAGHD